MKNVKQRRWALPMTIIVMLVATGSATAADQVIHAGRLIDGVSPTMRSNVSLVIHDDKIVSIEQGFITPPGATVIDLSKATVLPGMIDAHTHMTSIMAGRGPGNLVQWNMTHSPLDAAVRATRGARQVLEGGITSIREVGSNGGADFAVKRAIDDGVIPGPRMWVAGSAIGPTAGHTDGRTGYDPGLENEDWIEGVADGPESVAKAVRERKRLGATVIKIAPSGGVASVGDDPTVQTMTDEEIKAAIDTAHNLHLRVAAHAHGKQAIDTAVRLGVDTIEHGTYADEGSFALMKQHGTILVPTMAVTYGLKRMVDTAPETASLGAAQKINAVAQVAQVMVGKAYKAGVKIALGTDLTGIATPFGKSGEEMGYFVQAGMPPMAAIQAGTENSAEALGAADIIGSLRAGRFADVIAVAGDPLADISEMVRVKFVMKGGTIVKNELRP